MIKKLFIFRENPKEPHKGERKERNRSDNRGRGRQYSDQQGYWGYRQESGRSRGGGYGKNPGRSNSTSSAAPWGEQPRRGRGKFLAHLRGQNV